ncbi:protein of unknown function [Enterobacter cancerogenus]|nr:protein of unknown function [Enterobacter cancerogenus]
MWRIFFALKAAIVTTLIGKIKWQVPFTSICAEYTVFRTCERDKGATAAPLIDPRGPAEKSVLRTALTSRPFACGRLDSTSCLVSPLASTVRRFQRGLNGGATFTPQSRLREPGLLRRRR